MKLQHILLFASFAAFILPSCEEGSMCNTDNDCRNMCLTYENNAVAYACVDNRACKCLTEEATICEGNAENDKCQDICDTFYPGKRGTCIMAKCECQDAEN
ncbi:MAG: hypothetical protein J6S69_00760 [Proteobacteria bacterium]|jgi:hypothetical protein|nr:hypothetical protein [Pseudomonadota bacterium]